MCKKSRGSTTVVESQPTIRIHIHAETKSRIMTKENTLYSKWLRKSCERVVCERWVRDWTNCNILTFVFSSTSFSFCWAAQSGFLRAHIPLMSAGSLYNILSPANWTSCRTGLYHCLTSTCFLWASHLHPIQTIHSQGYNLISGIK